jgi:hypothetical protein
MFWRLVVFEVYHTAGTRYRELFGNKGPVVCHCEQRQGAEPCFHFDLSKHQMSDELGDRIIKRSFRDAFDGVSVLIEVVSVGRYDPADVHREVG